MRNSRFDGRVPATQFRDVGLTRRFRVHPLLPHILVIVCQLLEQPGFRVAPGHVTPPPCRPPSQRVCAEPSLPSNAWTMPGLRKAHIVEAAEPHVTGLAVEREAIDPAAAPVRSDREIEAQTIQV